MPVSVAGAALYFNPPDFTAPAVTPDGRSVGFIAQSGGHACLFKLDRATGQIEGVFSAGEGDVDAFWWVGNKRVLVAGNGEEGREYFVQDLTHSKPRAIPSLKGVFSSGITILPDDNDHIVAVCYFREEYLARIDLRTGHSSKIESLDFGLDARVLYYFYRQFLEFSYLHITSYFEATAVSKGGELRAKLWQEGGKWHIAWRSRAGQPWHTVENSSEELPVLVPAGMASDDRHILMYAHDQGNTEALMLLDPDTGHRTLLAQRPDHDIYSLVGVTPKIGPIGVEFYNNGPVDRLYFEESEKQFFAALERSLPGMVHRVTSMSKDGNVRIIEAWPPGYPSRYFLYDGQEHRLTGLGEQRPGIAPGTLGNVHFFQFTTRDGLNESGYVLMPNHAGPSQPCPLLVMAIGAIGEGMTSAHEFNAQDQYLSGRGFAVAHIAVRGSSGFGREFEKAGDFQLGGKVVQDLEDGVGHLAREGLVDPHRVAIMGYGLGGLFALRTAAVSPTFHAVIAYNTRCDLNAASISWLSSSRADTPTIIKMAGGTQAAYNLVHPFEPESFMDKLSVPALLIYASSYGYTGYEREAGIVRASFERHHKTYEWYHLDFHAADRVKSEVYQAQLYTKIADYLDQALK